MKGGRPNVYTDWPIGSSVTSPPPPELALACVATDMPLGGGVYRLYRVAITPALLDEADVVDPDLEVVGDPAAVRAIGVDLNGHPFELS